MWVFLSNSFLSIVQHKDDPELLMVRARVKGDIERVFPNVVANETPDGDYRFRAVRTRAQVKLAMEHEVSKIDYVNFKNSVPDQKRHDAYLDCWFAMNALQRLKLKASKAKNHVAGHPKVSK